MISIKKTKGNNPTGTYTVEMKDFSIGKIIALKNGLEHYAPHSIVTHEVLTMLRIAIANHPNEEVRLIF